MTDIAFYHLTASPQEDALPVLLNKTMAAGKTAMVASDPKAIPQLSQALWSFGHTPSGRGGITYGGEGSWLAHGVAGKDDDDSELCPIWFAADTAQNPTEASFGFYLDGHDPLNAPQQGQEFDRIFVLFNGLDDDAVTQARGQWKALRDAGHMLSYWTQDDSGKWQKTA